MTMAMKNIIVGTAGHIDHGKSALIEALTGTHPDRLEEEKRRGITLDLGFAFLDLGATRIGFVDVPGHERFVSNMLAGASGFDLVLLVIAADNSIQPQTREHFDICRLLGIERGIVALTKIDLVDADTLGLVRLEVADLLRGSFLESAPVVPVSAKSGAGMDTLRLELARVAAQVPEKSSTRYFRLPIDRAFVMKGFGTVVTGTLVSGDVRPEDEVELFPSRRRVRVRGVQSRGLPVERAAAGQRTALNLAGVDLQEVSRGMVLASPGRFEVTSQIDARISTLQAAPRLKHRARVHFHQGTTQTIAQICMLENAAIAPAIQGAIQCAPGEPTSSDSRDGAIQRQAIQCWSSCASRSPCSFCRATASSCGDFHRSSPSAEASSSMLVRRGTSHRNVRPRSIFCGCWNAVCLRARVQGTKAKPAAAEPARIRLAKAANKPRLLQRTTSQQTTPIARASRTERQCPSPLQKKTPVKTPVQTPARTRLRLSCRPLRLA